MTILASEHERLLVERFVKKDKRERIGLLLSKPGSRRRLRAKFSSTFKFLEEKKKSIPPSDQTPAGIHQRLQAMGAPDHCYLISEDIELDGKQLDLRETLDQLIGGGIATVVSCIPGKLAYFEGERQERYILSY